MRGNYVTILSLTVPNRNNCSGVFTRSNLLTMKTVKYTKLVLIVAYALSLALPVRAQGSAPASSHLNLMPVPASVRLETGRLAINGSFNVAVKDHTDDRLRAGRLARRGTCGAARYPAGRRRNWRRETRHLRSEGVGGHGKLPVGGQKAAR